MMMATQSSSGRRMPISIETKLAVLEALKTKSKIDVSKEFGIGYSTVKKIKQRELEILKKSNVHANLHRIRDRKSRNDEVGEAVITWYRQMKADNAINGPMMLEKAKEIAYQLGYDDFKPSHGWLERLKARNNIRFQKPSPQHNELDLIEIKTSTQQFKTSVAKTFGGQLGHATSEAKLLKNQDQAMKNEAKSLHKTYELSNSTTIVNDIEVQLNCSKRDDWVQNVLPSLIGEYEPDDVFNAAETVLFYRAAPSILTGNSGQIGMIKDRMTVFFMCNATGTEKHLYVIGKARDSVKYERDTFPPLGYYITNDGVMCDWIWRDILQKVSKKLKQRKIILFVKDIPCHKTHPDVSNINVSILPTNPVVIQPLDQGIVRQVKIYYRAKLLQKLITVLNNGTPATDFAKTITTYVALSMLESACCSISESMIVDCFQKAGFYADDVYCLEQSPDASLEAAQLKQLLQDEYDAFVECDREADCFKDVTDSTARRKKKSLPVARVDLKSPDHEKAICHSRTKSPAPLVSHSEALKALSVVRKYLQENFKEYNAFYQVEKMVKLNAYSKRVAEDVVMDIL